MGFYDRKNYGLCGLYGLYGLYGLGFGSWASTIENFMAHMAPTSDGCTVKGRPVTANVNAMHLSIPRQREESVRKERAAVLN